MMNLHAMSQTQLVTHALVLALIAPSDRQASEACELADFIAAGLTDEQIESCKYAALQMAEGRIGGGGAV